MTRYNPERREFRGRSHRKGGERFVRSDFEYEAFDPFDAPQRPPTGPQGYNHRDPSDED